MLWQTNNNLLKAKRILNIKMSTKEDPVFTFSLSGGGLHAYLPSVTPLSTTPKNI